MRLPESIIAALKLLANKRDVPYQSLLTVFLAEKVEEELRHGHAQRNQPRAGEYGWQVRRSLALMLCRKSRVDKKRPLC